MKATRLFTGFIGLLLALAFFGCADHRFPEVTPGADRLRIKSITQEVTGSSSLSTVSAFSYDANNRLSLIIAFQLPDSSVAPVENTLYQYDAQNRLIQVDHSTVRRGSDSETYMLTYNGAGQLARLENSPSTFAIIPQYNSANKVSRYSRNIDLGGLTSSGGGEFTFTGNNLTSSTDAFSVSRAGGGILIVYSRSINTAYTFDNKINPFYGVFIIPAPGAFLPFPSSPSMFGPFYTFYGGIDNPFNLSQNNVLSIVSSNGTTTIYSYTYNAANLPTTRTTTTNGSVTEILHFAYESY